MAENEPEKLTVGGIKKMITDAVAEATKGGKTPEDKTLDPVHTMSGANRQASVAAQVQEELRKLHEKEEKEKQQAERDKGIDDQLAALTEKTQEKAPVERGRVHKYMGWGE